MEVAQSHLEDLMEEVLPIAAGIVAGFIVHTIVPARLKSLALVILTVLLGFLATYVSGELLISWAYVVFDSAQVMVAAAISAWLIGWWQHRSSHAR